MKRLITRVAELEFVRARGGTLRRARGSHRLDYTAVDEVGASFGVWLNAVRAPECRGLLAIDHVTGKAIVYRLGKQAADGHSSNTPCRSGGLRAREPAVDQS